MGDKIKVVNPHKSKFFINLEKISNGKVLPVEPNGGFVYLTEEELAYVINTSKAFKKGFLKVDEKSKEKIEDEIEVPESLNAMTDEEIIKFVDQNGNTIKKEIKDIDNIETMKRILEQAKKIDKSVGVIEAIEERIEELRK